jgi:hypothetical protein
VVEGIKLDMIFTDRDSQQRKPMGRLPDITARTTPILS